MPVEESVEICDDVPVGESANVCVPVGGSVEDEIEDVPVDEAVEVVVVSKADRRAYILTS